MLTRLAAFMFIALTSAASAQTDTFPSRPITLVAPNAAGGPLDVNARLIATALSDVLGRQVVVENRTGAGTAVGTASVARAAPDGHTLLLADITFVVGPSLIVNPNYDPQRDFVPVSFLSRSNLLLVVSPDFTAKSVSDVVATAKQKSGELQYAHGGIGTPPHLSALAFTKATATTMTPVAYRGSSQGVVDVLAGRVPIMFLGLSLSGPHVTAGKLRALAVTGANRTPAFSDVPTFTESKVDLGGISGGTWFGIVAPAGTPAPIVAKLNDAINKAVGNAATRTAFEASGHTVAGGTSAEFGAFLKSQQAYWSATLDAAGVRPQ